MRSESALSASVHEYRVNGALISPPAQATITTSIEHWARTEPERPYLTWCSSEGETEVLTFGELNRRTRLLAESMVADSGDGVSVAVLPGNDIPSVVGIFAALRASIPCMILAPSDPVPRLRSVLREHPVARVLRSPLAAAQAAQLAEVIPSTELCGAGGNTPELRQAVPATWPALLFGTSGSTAASKLVIQSHRALMSNADAVVRHHGLDRDTVIMGGLPIHHVNGVHFTLIAPMYAGAHVVLPQELSPFAYPALLDRHSPHIASVVPTVLEALLARRRTRPWPASLRYFVSAAAPLSASLARRFVAGTGVRVLQGYGLSEATNFSTTVPADLAESVYREVLLDAPIPSVGIALHGNEVTVRAKDGGLCGERQEGEICMRGHNVMEAYAGRPDLTQEAFAGGWFHSGDLGYWARARDGRTYFYITGRRKNMAKIRGETVSVEEVERALISLDGVRDAACVAVPHPTWGEHLVAFVSTAPGTRISAIRIQAAALLAASAVPTVWRQVDSIPRTATGKLLRPELRELAQVGSQP